MRTKHLAGFMVVLLFWVTAPARACCEGDPPGNAACYECRDSQWVLKAGYDCGSILDCSACYTCQNCLCTCAYECCKDSDCDTVEHCETSTCSCVCDGGSCSDTEYVPPSAEVCPPCEPTLSFCTGMVEIYPLGYDKWVPVSPGGYGYCKNPTRLEIVGTLFECTEDWNGDKLIACAIGTGFCIAACVGQQWIACVGCFGVTIYGCVIEGEGLCSLVDACIYDPASGFSIQRDVPDGGADWGDLRKCG